MVKYFENVEPSILIFIGTSFFAFISWLLTGLIEKPLLQAKDTFNKFFEKRVELLTEIKIKLNFIMYFPDCDDSKEFKEGIQTLLIKDGKAAYLNKLTLDAILRISIDPKTDKDLVKKTIDEIDEDLSMQIHKIQDEINFYKRYSNYNPFKRFIGFTILSIQYLLSLIIVISIFGALIYFLLYFNWYIKGICFILAVLILVLGTKVLQKK